MRKIVVVASLVFCACGGDSSSGLDGSKRLVDLTADERMKECVFILDQEGGPGHETMCGNATLRNHTVQECVDGLNAVATNGTCQATVAQSEACASAIGDDPCSLGGDACAPLSDPACSTQ